LGFPSLKEKSIGEVLQGKIENQGNTKNYDVKFRSQTGLEIA
jgi:hypothetical protein